MQASSSQEPLLEYALLLRCHLTDSMAIAGAGDSQTGPLSSAVVSTTVLTSMSAGSSSCNKSVEHTVFEKGGRSDSGVDLSVEDTVLGVNGALHGALIDSFVAERLLKQHQRRRSVERLRSLARSPPEGLASLPSRLSSLCRSYVELSAANVRIPQDTTSGSRATVEDVFSNQSWVQPTCDEGLFIQVPSVGFIQECRKSLVDSPLAGDFTFPDGTTYSDCQSNGPDGSYSSEKASSTRQPSMDVVQYNARNKTTLDVSSGRPKRDDGYLYGYGHVLLGLPAKSSDDSALETGVVLCLLSSSPEFNLLRSIALGIIPSLSVAAEEGGDALLGYQLRNLIPLLRPPNSHGACSPKPGDLFKISSGKWEFSFLRPHVQFYPFLNSPLSLLLASFSVDALRLLQTLLLTEERVIIIGSSAQHASACVVSALSMIVPLSWCGPLVPYLSPPQAEGCGLLDHLLSEVDTDMFLVGSTSDIIAPVILRTCNRYTARIWFADARTGYLGTSPPREYRHHGSAEKVKLQQRQQVELLPASEKVKKAIIGLTSDTQRTQFRAHMNAVASRESRLKAEVNDWVQAQQSGSLQLLLETMKLSDASSLASTGAAVNSGSCVAPPFLRDVTEETVSIVHGAFLEYNVQRIVGSYRKCIPPNELMAATSRRKLLKLSPQDFLVGTVGATLAEEVYHTRLFRRFERSVCKMEALGLLSALSGEAVKANSSQPLSPSNGPSVAFVMGPQWLSVMHVFFNRAICRFPELFPEIDPSLCRQLYARNVLMPAGLSYCPLALQRVGGWDGSAASSRGNGGGGGGGGGGGMKRFFTKVKQSFATGGSSQTIAAEPFIRCACAMGGTVSAAAVSSSMDLEGEADDPQAALSRVEDRRRRQLLLLQSTYSLPDSHRDALAVGSDGKAIPPSSVGATIRLTMDAVHSFETYHRRLAPIAVKAKATAVQRRAKQEIRAALTWHFIRLAMNFPTLYKLWMEAEDRQSSMLINDTTTDIARPKVEHTQPRYADLTEEHCTTIQIQPAPVIPTRTAPREMDLLDSLFHQSPPPRVPPRTPKHASTSSTGSNGAERAATSWERMAPHSSRSAPSSAPVVEADQWSSGRPQNFSPQATSSPTNADSRRGGNAETSSNAASLSSFGSQRREPYRSTDQHADPWKGFSTGVPENYPK